MGHAPIITPKFLDHVAMVLSLTTPAVAAFCADNRTGGCVYICDAEGSQLIHKMVGAPAPEKMAKYREFSREKALRLLGHPKHTTSRQSRDPEQQRYGGAVRLPGSSIIVSFTGFSEVDDEIYSAIIGMMLFRASYTEVLDAIDRQLNEEHWQAMKRVFKAAQTKPVETA